MNPAPDTATVDLRTAERTDAAVETTIVLDRPQDRLRVRLPSSGTAGRAEASFDGKSWSAKHYWREGDEVVYAFDEALPASTIRVRIPFAVP